MADVSGVMAAAAPGVCRRVTPIVALDVPDRAAASGIVAALVICAGSTRSGPSYSRRPVRSS